MIQLILAQGLVHPVQIVPYLICMSTDLEQRVSHTADKELQDIEKKYPGFIHMKLMKGIRLSFQLQEVLISHFEMETEITIFSLLGAAEVCWWPSQRIQD